MSFDPRDADQDARFTRRALFLLGGQLAVAGVLGWRMHQLQIVEGENYQMIADENRINTRAVGAQRGLLTDRSGAPLAINSENYRVRLIRERAGDFEATLARLQTILELDPEEARQLAEKAKRTRAYRPLLVAENLSWAQFARLNANAPALPGVELEAAWKRNYPAHEDLAHVVGYVAAVNKKDLAADRTSDPLLRIPDARIGKSGVEQFAEKRLRGAAGKVEIEVNAGGREIRELSRVDGAPGEDLELTLDLELQKYAMARLGDESAAAVVMDVWSGDVLALASNPAFDPNKFVGGISQKDYSALLNNPRHPLRNKAIAGAYPPGSTFKMLTALAALEEGVMDANERVTCNGKFFYGDRTFHCWKRRGHGRMNLHDALKHSCDVYFYDAARRVGIEKLAALAQRFGIGEAPPLEMPNVKSGIMPTPRWMRAERGEGWSGGHTLNVGIGQGAVLTTPLQLATMTARIANGAHMVQPRLIRGVNGQLIEPGPFDALGVSSEHLKRIHDGMSAVSNEPGGTAFRSRIADPEMQLAGKTGTAQVRRIGKAEREAGVRKNEDLPWRLRDHALFVAFAPLDAPRYAISVVVEHGGGGSKAAAPIARDILMRALYGPEPPLEAYTPEMRKQIKAAREVLKDANGAPQIRGLGVDPSQ